MVWTEQDQFRTDNNIRWVGCCGTCKHCIIDWQNDASTGSCQYDNIDMGVQCSQVCDKWEQS